MPLDNRNEPLVICECIPIQICGCLCRLCWCWRPWWWWRWECRCGWCALGTENTYPFHFANKMYNFPCILLVLLRFLQVVGNCRTFPSFPTFIFLHLCCHLQGLNSLLSIFIFSFDSICDVLTWEARKHRKFVLLIDSILFLLAFTRGYWIPVLCVCDSRQNVYAICVAYAGVLVYQSWLWWKICCHTLCSPNIVSHIWD